MRTLPKTTSGRLLAGSALAGAIALSGCGGGKDDPSGGDADTRSWSVAEFMKRTGTVKAELGLGYALRDHPKCTVFALARSRQGIDVLRRSGSEVVTNPAGDGGAALDSGVPASCSAAWTAALRNLER